MRHVSAFFNEPNALDVFAYRGFLFVLTFNGRILQYDVAELARQMQSEAEESGLAIAYGLFSSKGIGAWPEMKTAWQSFHLSEQRLKITPIPMARSRFVIEASAHLDMRVFYNQMFLATDTGTIRIPLGPRGTLPEDREDIELLVDKPTESLSTGLGAVGASLGDEGLAVFTNVGSKGKSSLIRLDIRSLRSSIGWGNTVNHPTHDSYEVLPSEVAESKSGRRTLVGVRAPAEVATDSETLDEDSYAVWESGRLLVGNMSGVDSHGRFTGRRRSLTYSSDGSPLLWLGATGNRCIVTETPTRVEVMRGEESTVLFEGPTASIRTFPSSQRYRRLIASTVEGGFLLSAAFPTPA
ncbi:hypothetical protein PJL15_01877 [Paenarthrobacter nitroguajacolicus]|nr:hypothetical protein [Paenarthrobacter nitroguajacolicus]